MCICQIESSEDIEQTLGKTYVLEITQICDTDIDLNRSLFGTLSTAAANLAAC